MDGWMDWLILEIRSHCVAQAGLELSLSASNLGLQMSANHAGWNLLALIVHITETHFAKFNYHWHKWAQRIIFLAKNPLKKSVTWALHFDMSIGYDWFASVNRNSSCVCSWVHAGVHAHTCMWRPADSPSGDILFFYLIDCLSLARLAITAKGSVSLSPRCWHCKYTPLHPLCSMVEWYSLHSLVHMASICLSGLLGAPFSPSDILRITTLTPPQLVLSSRIQVEKPGIGYTQSQL